MASILVLFLGVLLFPLMKPTPAEASLYPTKPVANTTYIAGQAAHVTWVEDGTLPLLASLGRMKIDLFAGNNVSCCGERDTIGDLVCVLRSGLLLCCYALTGMLLLLGRPRRPWTFLTAFQQTLLATLAKDIDPLALSTTIFIPSSVPPHYYRL